MTDQLTGLVVKMGVFICRWLIQDSQKGAPIPKGAPTYYLANFSQKLHENGEILGREGGAGTTMFAIAKDGRHQGERNLLELYDKERNLV